MNCKKIISTLVLTAGLLMSTVAWAASITNLRTSVSPARVRVVLDSAEPIKFKDSKDGLTLTVALPESSAKKQAVKVKDDGIAGVELVPDGKNASKLVIKLKKDAQYKAYQLPNPHRLVVDIFRIQIVTRSQELAQGVNYTFRQDEFNGRQIQAHLVEVAPTAKYELQPFSAAGSYNGRGRLSVQAAQQNMLAAINASYFDTDGWVIGTIKNKQKMMAMDTQPRSGYVLVDGKPQIVQDIAYYGTVLTTGRQELRIKGMNRARIADDLVLYNEFYAPSTKTNQFGREIKIKNNRVVEVSTAGNMRIEPGTYILSGHGASAAAMAKVSVGDPVQLTQGLGGSVADAADTVVSGGPLLVENGRVNVRSVQEKMAADITRGRAPRTGVGLKKDGTLMLLVVDGRSSVSSGLTLPELAQYFLRLGAVDAVNYDGGGSSEMVVKGRVVNRPSDGKERPVSIGLGLMRKR